MRNQKVIFTLPAMTVLFVGNAFASSSSQILVMSSQLMTIANDLTSGALPTAVLLIAIGLWGMVNVFGKGLGDGIHQLANIIAVGGIVVGAAGIVSHVVTSAQM